MRFAGKFTCGVCGHEYTVDLGPEKLGELKTRKKIVELTSGLLSMVARSCMECEAGHDEATPASPQAGDNG